MSVKLFVKGKTAADHACEILKTERRNRPNEKLAIVLDIDECSIMTTCDESISPPNPYIFQLYKCAKKLQYEIIFVTARGTSSEKSQSVRNLTKDELRRAGYQKKEKKNFYKIYFQSGEYFERDTVQYKYEMREKISTTKTIVIAVGDNYWDLSSSPKLEQSIRHEKKKFKEGKTRVYAIVKGFDQFAIFGWKVPSC